MGGAGVEMLSEFAEFKASPALLGACPELANYAEDVQAEHAIKLLHKLALLVKKRRHLDASRSPPCRLPSSGGGARRRTESSEGKTRSLRK